MLPVTEMVTDNEPDGNGATVVNRSPPTVAAPLFADGFEKTATPPSGREYRPLTGTGWDSTGFSADSVDKDAIEAVGIGHGDVWIAVTIDVADGEVARLTSSGSSC